MEDDSDQGLNAVGTEPRDKNQRDAFIGIYNNPQYTPLIDLVSYAKSTIDIEIYMMNDPAFRHALRAAMKNGVVIRVVKDGEALGETCKYFEDNSKNGEGDCPDQRALVSEIKSNHGEFVRFDKDALCGQTQKTGRCYEHGKLMIVDRDDSEHRLALLSTGNFNNSNLCVLEDNPSACNRDYSYVTRDKSVIDGLVAIFESDLKSSARYNNSAPQKITVSPFSKTPLIDFVKSAKTRIQIENQYMKDDDWNRAIMDMAKQVTVEMMVATDCAFGPPKQKDQLQARYKAFEDAGVKLKFFTAAMKQRGKNGYLHAKAIVVDNTRAWIGSVNGSSTSLDQNREYGIFFSQPDRVTFLSQVMDHDFNDSLAQTSAEDLNCGGTTSRSRGSTSRPTVSKPAEAEEMD